MEPPQTQKNYKEIISSLPRVDGIKLADHLYHYQGFWCDGTLLEGIMSAQDHFTAKPTDIFLCSAPKSGTTWLKALAFAIATRTHFDDSTTPLLTTNPHGCVPMLEFEFDLVPQCPKIPLFATHVPSTSLPQSIHSLGCKIVYICRDPKDVLVSLWHFVRRLTPKGQEAIALEAAFELFCDGVSLYGPYWDHVLGYWKASLEWPERVLFIKYEDMMKDAMFYVKRLAEFMGYPFSLEEEKEGAVQKIVKLCSFENLSNLEVNNMVGDRVAYNAFFRKGKVGDWENYLTAHMAERLDQISEQKLGPFGFSFTSSN